MTPTRAGLQDRHPASEDRPDAVTTRTSRVHPGSRGERVLKLPPEPFRKACFRQVRACTMATRKKSTPGSKQKGALGQYRLSFGYGSFPVANPNASDTVDSLLGKPVELPCSSLVSRQTRYIGARRRRTAKDSFEGRGSLSCVRDPPRRKRCRSPFQRTACYPASGCGLRLPRQPFTLFLATPAKGSAIPGGSDVVP